MNPPATVFPSRAWVAGVLLAMALAVAVALGAGCGIDVPLGVDPRSDGAVLTDAGAGGG